MLPDIELLRAFVDGELPPQQRAEVEAAVAANAELAATVATLFASRLPYHSAFAQVPVPAVPQDLQRRVAELAAVASASHAGSPAVAHTGRGWRPLAWLSPSLSSGNGSHDGSHDDSRNDSRNVHGGLPGGKLLWLLLLLAGMALGYAAATQAPPWAAGGAEPWVRKVSSYHSMYGRETVADDAGGLAQAAALQVRLQRQGLNLRIPDLSAQGLRFVRAQQLQFDGKPVLQMVYLPSDGAPVALCLTPAAAQPERAISLDGLRAVTWQAGAWAYVLIGSLPTAQLQTIRQQIPAALI